VQGFGFPAGLRYYSFQSRRKGVFEVYRFPADYLPYWFLVMRTGLGAFKRFLRRCRTGGALRLLDIGCGGGGYSLYAACTGDEVTGLDLSHSNLCNLRQTEDRLPDHPRIRWVAGDGYELPFGDHSFDVVLSSHVIEHLRNPRPMLDEIARVLRPGGTLYLQCPSTHHNMRICRWFGINLDPPEHIVEGYEVDDVTAILPDSLCMRRHGYQARFVEANFLDLQMALARLTGLRAIPQKESAVNGTQRGGSSLILRLAYPFKEAVLLAVMAVAWVEDRCLPFVPGCFSVFECERVAQND